MAGRSNRHLIYLDYAASAPMHPEAVQAVRALLEPDGPFANPSSIHRAGRQARRVLDSVREAVARELGVDPGELVFTSGGTEADNLGLVGAARAVCRRSGRRGVVASAIEHHAVLHAAEALRQEGFAVRLARSDERGVVHAESVAEAIGQLRAAGEEPAIVALMLVNNEVGTLQPVEQAGQQAREAGALFFVDAVQGPELDELWVPSLGCDLLALSAHKFGGPKGAGVLFVRSGIPFDPLFYGGGQERQLRPGTQNVLGIAGMGAAFVWTRTHRAELRAHKAELEARLLSALRSELPDATQNGEGAPRAAGIVNVYVPEVEAETLLVELDLEGVACSAGAACTAGALQASHVLMAMGLGRRRASCSIRISFGWATTADEVEEAAGRIAEAARRIRGRRRARPEVSVR